jgi:hypothetical protein
MSQNAAPESSRFPEFDRIYLENLRLATAIILRVGEDPGALPNTLESELFIFRDRVDHALLAA